MRWLMGLLIALLAGCAIPPKPRYDATFWRELADAVDPQPKRTTP